MRMPLLDFLINGDLKFVIILNSLLIISIYFFIKKIMLKTNKEFYNDKLLKLFKWTITISVFSLLLGLLHSFYFIANANGIAPKLLFSGLVNMLITPTLGIAISIIIQIFLSVNIKEKTS